MRWWIGVTLVGCSAQGDAPARPECPDEAFDPAAMEDDVAWLASPALDGRYPGSPGDAEAADMVAERFACLGLSSFDDDYLQPFTDAEGNETANVIAVLPGADAAVGEDVVVVSAHLDHFGDGLLGANDDASGIAGLLAIAQAFVEDDPPDRTVVFAAFGAEESGFEGSEHFLARPPAGFDPRDVVYNVNMDMIGSYSSTDTVYALGTMRGTPGRDVVQGLLGDYPALDVGLGDYSDLSDNVSFCARGVDYVFFWTEDLECYHEACDTADSVDYEHLVEIAALAGDVAWELADTPDDLRASVRAGADVCGG